MKDRTINNSIRLRYFNLEDIDTLKDWESDQDSMLSLENTINFDELKEYLYLSQNILREEAPYLQIIEDDKKNKLGYLQIYNYDILERRVAIGIFVDRKYRGLGIGSMALASFVKHLFDDKKIRMIYAKILANNFNSKAIFEKNNFEKVAQIPQWKYYDNDYISLEIYQICNPKY